MRKLRSLRWLCSLSLVASLLCGVAFGAGIPDLDDLGIDPWGEYEELPSVLPTVQPTPSQEPEEGERGEVYSLQADVPLVRAARASSGGSGYTFSAMSGYITIGTGETLSTFVGTSLSDGYNDFYSWTPVTASDGSNTQSFKVYIQAKSTYTITKNVSISASSTSKIYLNGTFSCVPFARWVSASSSGLVSARGYGSMRLLINGKAVGNTFSGNQITLNNYGVNVTQNIYSIGIQYTFSDAVNVYKNNVSFANAYAGLWLSDGLSIVTDDKGGSAETNGLLGSIIDFLNLMLQGITNIFTTLAELPGQIVTALIDGLKSLFIPSAEDIENIKVQYLTLLEERLGFLWQAMTFITDTAQKFLTALEGSSDYVFNLPALTITLPSGEFTLVQAQTLDFDNGLMTAVRTAAGTMVSFVVVLGFLNVSEKMVIAIVSGKSYFDYLKGGGEE